MSLEVIGKNLNQLKNEAGNHVINRVPPTERRGRVHTSIISVAILDEIDINLQKFYMRDDNDYRFEIFKATGPGGQSRNKTSSGVKCTHIPTGIKQERTQKCQHRNKKEAVIGINDILDNKIAERIRESVSINRNISMGTGSRGSKIRIYKFQIGTIIDIITGKKIRVKDFLKGNINKLWN